jgi:hypothetical protein
MRDLYVGPALARIDILGSASSPGGVAVRAVDLGCEMVWPVL